MVAKFQAIWRGYIFRKRGIKAHPKFANIHAVINLLSPESRLCKLLKDLIQTEKRASEDEEVKKAKKGKKGKQAKKV